MRCVGPENTPEHIADLAEGRAGVDRVDEARHEILRPLGGPPDVVERRLCASAVAASAESLRPRDLIALDGGIDALDRDARPVARFVELVDADDDLVAALDRLLRAVGRVADLVLHPAALDRRDRAALRVDLGDQLARALRERVGERLDVVRARQRIDPAIERDQVARTQAFRARRDAARAQAALDDVRRAAESSENLMPRFVDAVDAGATLGEICDVLRSVFGTYAARERIA